MRSLLIASYLLCLVPLPAKAENDPWFGRDKALHFGVSAALAGGGYAAGATIWEEPAPALLLGAGLALAAGAGKELWDLAGHGHPSWRDMAWNVAGTGAGLLLGWTLHSLLRQGEGEGERAQPAAFTLRW